MAEIIVTAYIQPTSGTDSYYWTSEQNGSEGFVVRFETGTEVYGVKTTSYRARCMWGYISTEGYIFPCSIP